jgi:hypothetical protein
MEIMTASGPQKNCQYCGKLFADHEIVRNSQVSTTYRCESSPRGENLQFKSEVDHPTHYGGDVPYEAIKVIEAWGLGFCLGNAVKYISRAGKKDPSKEIEDLEKALWYLRRHIEKARSGK